MVTTKRRPFTIFKFPPGNPNAGDGDAKTLLHLPAELMGKIASYLEPPDLGNLRLVNKQVNGVARHDFLKVIGNRTLFPRYEYLHNFLTLLHANQDLPNLVREVTLVMDTLRWHEHGYEWAWETLRLKEEFLFTDEDIQIIQDVNEEHEASVTLANQFIISGGFRSSLKLLLRKLPKLRNIYLRKLRPGEHLPGWAGPKLLKKLSVYSDDLDVNNIFYGDWQYDLKHKCITIYTDECGDRVHTPDIVPGPQSTFMADLRYALPDHGNQENAKTRIEVWFV